MIEFAVLLHLKRKLEEKLIYANATTDKNITEELIPKTEKHAAQVNKNLNKRTPQFITISNKIDNIAIVVFMILFCTFNCVYWTYYLLL